MAASAMSYGTRNTTNQISGIFGGSLQRTTPDRIGTVARRSGPVNHSKCGGGAATFRSGRWLLRRCDAAL